MYMMGRQLTTYGGDTKDYRLMPSRNIFGCDGIADLFPLPVAIMMVDAGIIGDIGLGSRLRPT